MDINQNAFRNKPNLRKLYNRWARVWNEFSGDPEKQAVLRAIYRVMQTYSRFAYDMGADLLEIQMNRLDELESEEHNQGGRIIY